MDRIATNRLDRSFFQYQLEFEKKAIEVLRSGWYILGNELSSFENEFANYLGAKFCVGLASGLDALWMAFKLLNIKEGDEVLVQANTYIASVMGITINGAKPVFVEPDDFYNIDVVDLEKKITSKTKAILVVHLYGQASNMEKILEIKNKYNLFLVEDCAQSHGACYLNQKTGTFGDIGCFSFYPSKNLGAFGDAGCIVTNNEEIAENARVLRNYGSEKRYYNKCVGTNSRLDEIQAGLLRVRLKHIEQILNEKKFLSERYLKEITNSRILLPKVRKNSTHIWHQFVVRCDNRDELISYLDKNGISTIIHYPIPPHLSQAYGYLGFKVGSFPITEKYANTVLSIPLYNGMKLEEQDYVIQTINNF